MKENLWQCRHPPAGRFDALLLQGISEPVRVISTVGEQGRCTDVIADLVSRDEEAQRTAVGISHGMQLRVHAALGPAYLASTPPFFTARLDAVRCAFR